MDAPHYEVDLAGNLYEVDEAGPKEVVSGRTLAAGGKLPDRARSVARLWRGIVAAARPEEAPGGSAADPS